MKHLAAVMLAVFMAACEPSPNLDGAPSPGISSGAEAPASSGVADPLLPPGELAGGPPPGALLAGVINLVPPAGAQVVENCETIIAADYTTPPKMVCLVFGGGASGLDLALNDAMAAAGWSLIRSQGAEHYFERPAPGGDCADIAVVSEVGDRKDKLAGHMDAPAESWRAYSIPASIHEACGADRMKP